MHNQTVPIIGQEHMHRVYQILDRTNSDNSQLGTCKEKQLTKRMGQTCNYARGYYLFSLIIYTYMLCWLCPEFYSRLDLFCTHVIFCTTTNQFYVLGSRDLSATAIFYHWTIYNISSWFPFIRLSLWSSVSLISVICFGVSIGLFCTSVTVLRF
jgi:hypothetical protein